MLPVLLSFVNEGARKEEGEEMTEAVLTTLANVAVLSTWHEEFYTYLSSLYALVDEESLPIKLQSLKLLVNLSTNPDMVPSLLAAKVMVNATQLLFSLNPFFMYQFQFSIHLLATTHTHTRTTGSLQLITYLLDSTFSNSPAHATRFVFRGGNFNSQGVNYASER